MFCVFASHSNTNIPFMTYLAMISFLFFCKAIVVFAIVVFNPFWK